MKNLYAHLKTFLCFTISLIVYTLSAYPQNHSLVAGDTTTAKVIYHNIPDITFVESWNSYEVNIDINENGINDINFFSDYQSHTTEISYSLWATPINGCWFAQVDTSLYTHLKVFNNGDTIDIRCNWSKCCNQPLVWKRSLNVPPFDTSFGGDWLNQSNKYLGVRYIENGDTLYAWVELSGWEVGLSIQSYAYMKKSSASDVGENSHSHINIYPNPANDIIKIETSEAFNNSYIAITGVSGQELIKYNINKSPSQIDISRLKAGIYMVQLVNSENVYPPRKLIVE